MSVSDSRKTGVRVEFLANGVDAECELSEGPGDTVQLRAGAFVMRLKVGEPAARVISEWFGAYAADRSIRAARAAARAAKKAAPPAAKAQAPPKRKRK